MSTRNGAGLALAQDQPEQLGVARALPASRTERTAEHAANHDSPSNFKSENDESPAQAGLSVVLQGGGRRIRTFEG
jgi:hypothetical protein